MLVMALTFSCVLNFLLFTVLVFNHQERKKPLPGTESYSEFMDNNFKKHPTSPEELKLRAEELMAENSFLENCVVKSEFLTNDQKIKQGIANAYEVMLEVYSQDETAKVSIETTIVRKSGIMVIKCTEDTIKGFYSGNVL